MPKETKNKIILEIKRAAQKRGVNFEFLHRTYYSLSKGKKKITFTESMPETTSAISYRITENKFLTNLFLRKWGFPVLEMEYYLKREQAEKFIEKNKKIVIKPERGMHGKGITVGLSDKENLSEAVDFAKKNDPQNKVVLEQHREGDDYRVLVVGKKDVFVSKKEPAFVIGNGSDNILELLEQRNKKLIEKYKMNADEVMKKCLTEQSLSINSILENDQKIYLKKTANIKSGGTSADYTDKISSKIKKTAISIASKLDMDVAGLDIMTKDIGSEEFSIIEVNSYPGILLHIYPVKGESQDVADAIVKYFFPSKEK